MAHNNSTTHNNAPPTSYLRRPMLAFTLLSLADLGLTYWLLEHSRGGFYESNPVAQQILTSLGWIGLALFKAGIVALVLGLLVIVARRSPAAARRGLIIGCLLVGTVVAYSASLTMAATPQQKVSHREHLYWQSERQRMELMDAQQHWLSEMRAKTHWGNPFTNPSLGPGCPGDLPVEKNYNCVAQ